MTSDGPAREAPERWTDVASTAVGAAACAVLLLVGAFAGRPDVAVLGAAPLVVTAWHLLRRPSGPVRGAVDAGEDGASGTLTATVVLEAPAGAVAARVDVLRHDRPVADALVDVRRGRRLRLVTRTVRTGPQEVATVQVQGVGPGLLSVSDPAPPATRRTVVLPAAGALPDVPLPPRLRGLTGAHGSRRPGEGGDLRDVHPFGPGDRLRRIDWRVTARRAPDLRELWVRREHALAEAVVVLVVDSRDEVGPDPLTWRGSQPPRPQDATSLDRARQAAAAVARAFLDRGDRVGLDDLGVRRRPVPPGGGRRQLDRVRHALALTHPEGEPATRLRPPRLPSGALVVLFSTFLDDEALVVAEQWRRAGHRVVAVDVLPRVRTGHLGQRERLALRIVEIARADRLAALADHDVELVTWREAPEVALRTMARRSQRRPGAGVPA